MTLCHALAIFVHPATKAERQVVFAYVGTPSDARAQAMRQANGWTLQEVQAKPIDPALIAASKGEAA